MDSDPSLDGAGHSHRNMPDLSTAIFTTLLVILLTTLASQVAGMSMARAWQACYSRLRLLILTKFPQRNGRSRSRSLSNAAQVQVSHLFIHPVKSLRAVSIPQITIDAKGLVDDRRFMLVLAAPLPLAGFFGTTEATHRFLSQRQCPLLATVHVVLDNVTGTLTLSSTDQTVSEQGSSSRSKKSKQVLSIESVTVNTQPPPDSPVYRSSLWSDIVTVQDMGDAAADFFQQILELDETVPDELKVKRAKGGGVRMVVQAETDGRCTDDSYVPAAARTWWGQSPAVALGDGFPVLIACEASLQELNRRLAVKNKPPLPMSRFRPNIVISGTEAFAEDNWKVISINGILLHVVKGCPRCKESCTDQSTGQVTEEPLATLREFRALDPQNVDNVFFAQNAIPAVGAVGQTIEVGASVQVLQRGEPVWGD